MSLLSICQNVTAMNGFTSPSQIAQGTGKDARQLFALAKQALRNVSKFFDWPHLTVEHTITTVDGQERYPFPSDFEKVISPSFYNLSQYYRVRGSASPGEWQRRKNGLLASIYRYNYRLYYASSEFGITPTPTTADNLVCEYISTNHARSADATETFAAYEQDDHVAIVPEHMVELDLNWRFRRAKGLDYSAEIVEFNSLIAAEFSKVYDAGDIPVGGYTHIDPLTEGYVPENGFGV